MSLNYMNGDITKLARYGLVGVCLGLIGLVGFVVKTNYEFIGDKLLPALERNTNVLNELNITLKSKEVSAEIKNSFGDFASLVAVPNTMPDDVVQKFFEVVPFVEPAPLIDTIELATSTLTK